MKVCIEIKDKVFSLAANILNQKCFEEEKELECIVEKMKAQEEPVAIDLDKVDDE